MKKGKQPDIFEDDFDDKIDIHVDPDWNPQSELKKQGIYYIAGEINTSNLLSIHQDILLKHIDPTWKDDIQLIINSCGGSVADGYSLIDLLDWVKMDIRTIAIGFCGSMGACLACCGTPGKRLITRNTMLMIHGSQWEAEGNVHQLVTASREMQRDHERQVNFWLQHSKYTKREEIEKYFLHGKHDEYMDAKQALEHGIFDGICGVKRKHK